ncbi:MAG TPA: acyl-CoA dehydrogenase family protein [Alphaproteobacteria bacterium]|jgi:alkylation response protein AidB-like acyl-CoA dehydrogenase
MNFAFTDEQKLLADSVARFVAKDYPFESRRKLLASEAGWSRDTWKSFAELGWLAAPFAEDHGGLGGGPVEAAIVMENFGKGLVLEPYLPTVVLGGALLAAGGRRDLMQALVEGALQVSLAWVEPKARFDLAHVETRAARKDGGFALSGQKGVAFNAAAADWIVVPARTAGDAKEAKGITLFLVPKGAKGLTLRPYRTVDGVRAAEVALDNATLGPDSVLGEVDWGHPLLEAAIDRGIAAVCAEAAGIMAHVVATTRDYLKTRKQFGVPLASFQVLQHRAVDMYVLAEQAASMAYRAAVLADAREPAERARAVSAAKAWIGKAGRKVGQEAIQMHGGMGMTDEMPVSHYFKRLTMIDTLFGDHRFHRRRFAALGGHVEKD